MGIIELLMKRKKETEDASREYAPVKDDLEETLRKAEAERDRKYLQKQEKKETK